MTEREAGEGLDPFVRERTDTDELGSDPDVRFPGDAEDPTMTTDDAGEVARATGLGEGGGAALVDDEEPA